MKTVIPERERLAIMQACRAAYVQEVRTLQARKQYDAALMLALEARRVIETTFILPRQ